LVKQHAKKYNEEQYPHNYNLKKFSNITLDPRANEKTDTDSETDTDSSCYSIDETGYDSLEDMVDNIQKLNLKAKKGSLWKRILVSC
jgi:CBS-domain-containing membrane protein